MSRRRVRALTSAEIAALAAVEDSDDASVDSDDSSSEISEPDQLFTFEEEEAGEDGEESEEEGDATTPISLQQLTRSQMILDRAELELQPPRDAGPYMVRAGRGASTRWETTPPPPGRRRSSANVLREAVGLRSAEAAAVRHEADALKLFITEEIIEEIIKWTNKSLKREHDRVTSECSEETAAKQYHKLQPVSEPEMWAFLGLCVLRAFYRKLTIPELFSQATGPPVFSATMGGKRFSALLQHLSFDDRETREERRATDRFCLQRDFLDRFNAELHRHFRPSECLTLDESLVRFRGRCSFRMYVKNKPGKYGILLRTLADASYRCMVKVWPYSGQPEALERAPAGVHFDSIPAMVSHMVQEQAGSGRNITMDRFFTSTTVAENLLADRLTIVGTIDRRRRMPAELKEPRGREAGSSLFAYNGSQTAVSYCPKPKKLVTALSTQHQAPMVDKITKKPEILLYYNATKGGVDVLDAMVENYTYSPPLRRWPTAVFLFLLGIAQVNASTILMINRGMGAADVKKGARREVMFVMGQELVQPRIEMRACNPTGLTSATLRAIDSVRRTEPDAPVAGPSAAGQAEAAPRQGRCHFCLSNIKGAGFKAKKNRMNKKSLPCKGCGKYACVDHSVHLCQSCDASR